MQKYFCNTCNNKFFNYSSEIFNCPYCGSNDIQLKTKPVQHEYWKTPVFIFSVVALVVMLIVLIFLPSALDKYEVDLVLIPLQCKAEIIIKKGGHEEEKNLFSYSADDGKSWQTSNELISENPAIYFIKVRNDRDTTATFTYLFTNPVRFTPSCKPPPPDSCACTKLQILNVERKQQKLIIHTSLPKCEILYSVTGKDGSYGSDSIFQGIYGTAYHIFVKSRKCEPVGYRQDPYVLKKSDCGSYYTEDQVDRDYKVIPSSGIDKPTLEQNIRKELDGLNLTGTYIITFIVEKEDGSLRCIKITPGNDQIVSLRVNNYLGALGTWFTGYVNGNPVRTQVKLVIDF